SRSYDVLESLERKGFVVMKLGKPIKYIAIPPSEVVERVKKNVKEDADKRIKFFDKIKNTEIMGELNLLHKQGITLVDPADITGAVRGRQNLYSHLSFLIKNAEKYVYLMTSEQGLLRKAESLKNAFQKAKNKGVKIKILAPESKKHAPKNLSKVVQLKRVKDVPARFCVVDGKQVVFMVVDDEHIHPSYDFGVWVGTTHFAKSFENLFNLFWSKN
ncbi:hypothetical protein DRJ22_05965, partial [Candidatus Woesearchaeota archaeon]